MTHYINPSPKQGRQSMTKVLRPLPTTPYQQFRYDLESESPRAAYWLESMVFGLMAQVDDMTEDTALELACKIILRDANPSTSQHSATRTRAKLERMPADPANVYA